MSERRKNRLRWVSAVLALAVGFAALGFSPLPAYAIEFSTDGEGNLVANDADEYYYMVPAGKEASGECVLYVYGGAETDLVLPKKCGSYKVTTIGTDFSSMVEFLNGTGSSLTTVKIPSGYKTIASEDNGLSGAFQNQTGLYRVEIPKSVTKIGEHAFDGCNLYRLTIVTPSGSAAEKYAKAHGIYCTDSKKLKVVTGGKTMRVGEKKTIAVYNCPYTVKWKSSKPSVASVDKNGTVKAKKAGTTKITAKIGKKTYSYTFKVKKK